jgi:hypothetical protein
MHKFNPQSFCPEPWSQLEIDSEGDYKICCLANNDRDFGLALTDRYEVMNVLTHSPQEAMQSRTHKEHRLSLAQDVKPRRCSNCYQAEQAQKGIEGREMLWSKRQRVINQTARDVEGYVTLDTAADFTDSQGSSSAQIVNLDLRFGNLCNQRCVMCSPKDSNQWYQDWPLISGERQIRKGAYKIYPLIEDHRGRDQLAITPWWTTPEWWGHFEQLALTVKHIYFTGGEPLLVPAMTECLDRLIQGGHSQDIELRYDTNLTALNPRVIERWQQFKRVRLCVSVDDTEDRYHLIRNPGRWSQLKANLEAVQAQGLEIEYISGCVGLHTPYSVLRLIPIAESLGVRCYQRFLEKPLWLAPDSWSDRVKMEIIKTLDRNRTLTHYDSVIDSQINYYTQTLGQANPKRLELFLKNMTILDQSRGTNWRKTLPDVVKLIELDQQTDPHSF